MNLEEMRRELMLAIHDIVDEDVTVVRESADLGIKFPMVVVDFLGPQERVYKWISMVHGNAEGWIMSERVNIMISTIQPAEGDDMSRLELQELLDKIEYGARIHWPRIVRRFGCSIYYPDSWKTSFLSSFHGERRVNTAILKVSVLVPRAVDVTEGSGLTTSPVKKITGEYNQEGDLPESFDIQIS